VSYDVSDDKRRTRVFKTLMDTGDHVQYSVFLCELNDREFAELRGRLAETINHRQDQVLLLDMGRVDSELTSTLQYIGKAYEPPSRVVVV